MRRRLRREAERGEAVAAAAAAVVVVEEEEEEDEEEEGEEGEEEEEEEDEKGECLLCSRDKGDTWRGRERTREDDPEMDMSAVDVDMGEEEDSRRDMEVEGDELFLRSRWRPNPPRCCASEEDRSGGDGRREDSFVSHMETRER